MKNFLKYLLYLFLFWLLVFFVQRNVFLFSNLGVLDILRSGDILKANLYALRMDIASICYIMLFPTLCLIAWFILKKNWVRKVLNIYFVLIVIVSTFISVVDNGLFRAWGVKLTPKAIAYLEYPKEAVESAASSPLGLCLRCFSYKYCSIFGVILK